MPRLSTYHQVETKRGIEGLSHAGNNLEPTGGQDDGSSDPETSVRAERGGTEGVADDHLPHTSEELDQTAICEGSTDNNVGLSHATGLQVDEGEDKGGQGEGGETEGRGVGELALLGGAIGTGLELTAKGRVTGRVAGLNVGEGVAAIVVGLAGLGRGVGATCTVSADGAVVYGIDALRGVDLVMGHGVRLWW